MKSFLYRGFLIHHEEEFTQEERDELEAYLDHIRASQGGAPSDAQKQPLPKERLH